MSKDNDNDDEYVFDDYVDDDVVFEDVPEDSSKEVTNKTSKQLIEEYMEQKRLRQEIEDFL